ncbi:hypothetical protein SAMN05444372_1261 [Flavobacterium micromati]|uniref:Uncharacterized protein n=1 Tax=Flavobacterium micromati TaxID=229205 RepID=A0A1M5R682_9FLAO|nr:hypothetical protein [Flavobacterium micromati]SHH21343.1 hypothetical protein SAMN05444372_1261 [Flavobacterium micromati]
MKNYFFYTAIILLCITNFSNVLFAQLTNEKYKALNDYFETIVKDTTQVVFVAKEKINSNETLNIFGLNEILIVDSVGNWKSDIALFKKKEFEKMKKEYKNRCVSGKRIWWCTDDYWRKDNFRYKKIVLESMNTNKGIELIFEKYSGIDIDVYGFSEPIYYQNNKYVVFTVHKSHMAGTNTIIVIMKKIKCKWIVTHIGSNPNIIN